MLLEYLLSGFPLSQYAFFKYYVDPELSTMHTESWYSSRGVLELEYKNATSVGGQSEFLRRTVVFRSGGRRAKSKPGGRH